MNELAPALGVLAGAVGVVDTIPYVRDTLRGRTRPHRGTWTIWGLLAIVVFASQRADGASWSLVMAGTQVVLTACIVVLAIRLGTGGVSRADLLLLGVAGAGLAGWLLVDEPVLATACVIVADLVAAALMVPKTWRDPGSETFSTFVLASVGGALAAGAVGAPEPALLLYPVYYCVVNAGIAILIAHRRTALAPAGSVMA
jgi:hypothetical protein